MLAVRQGGKVALWDLTTRRPLTELPDAASDALAFSPMGGLLAVGSRGAAGHPGISLWDVSSRRLIKTFQHTNNVRSVASSPDGKLLATFDDLGRVRVMDWASDRTLTDFTVSQPRYTTAGVVAFSPEGSQLAIGEDYGRMRLLNLRTGNCRFLPTQPGVGVTALAFSPAADLLAAGYGYGVGIIRLWDPRSGEPRGELTNHTDSVPALVFTPDGQLASASSDGTVRIWAAAEHAELRRWRSSAEKLTALALLPNGQALVSGGSGGAICFWDATASRRTPAHTNMIVSPPFGSFAELDVTNFAPETLGPSVARRSGFAFTPDSRRFITLDSEGSLALWDARSLTIAEHLPALGSNHWGVALSPDGRWLVTGNCAGRLTIWDWTTRRAVTNFASPFEWFGRLRFSRSGHFFSAGMMRNDLTAHVRLWRTGDWEEVPLTGSPFAGLWSVNLSPDDRLLAGAYADGTIKLFRFPSGQPEATFTNHTAGVEGVHFSPDGRWLTSTSMDGSARLWDVLARQEVATLRGHFKCICGGALSPDGRRLATGGDTPRDAVKLWDLGAHRELLSLQAEGQYFFDLAFSPDGNILVATCLSGVAHLWRAPSWEEIEAAEPQSKTLKR